MSDWDATHSAAAALEAGLDQEMPGAGYFNTQLLELVRAGNVQRLNRGIDLEFRWCLRTVETVSGARTIEKVFWKATGHVRVVGTFHRPNRPLETYRSYESRTKRKSILCNAGNVSESRVDEAVAGVSTAVRACILLAKLEH